MTGLKARLVCASMTALVIASTAGAGPKPAKQKQKQEPKLGTPVWVFKSRQAQIPAPKMTVRGRRGNAIEWNQRGLPLAASPDAVFFTSAVDHRVVCLDAATGKKRWEFTTGAAIQMAPIYSDGKVYAGSDDGCVYCLDARTGRALWKTAPPHPRCMISYGRVVSAWPVRTNVPVRDGVAYFGSGVFPHDGTFVTAVDAKTGKRIWRNAAAGESPFDWVALSPTGYLGLGDGFVTVNCHGKGVKRFRLADGQPAPRSKGRAGGIYHPMSASGGGRKFTSTGNGVISCYAGGSGSGREIVEPIVGDPFGDAAAVKAAEAIVKEAGVMEGYALVADGRSGALALALARQTKLQVHVVFDDEAKADAARKALQRTGMYGERIVARHVRAGQKLPYPSFMFDLIVSETAALAGELPVDPADLNRTLKPIRGIAIIGGKATGEALKKWITGTKLSGWQVVDRGGAWAKRIRPRLKDAGEWTHQYADVANTSCSHDGVLKGPLGVIWYGDPNARDMRNRDSIAALISEGVLISPGANSIEGYDQYTGRWLWRRDMPRVSRAAGGAGNLAANKTSVFVIYNNQVLEMDLLTGKTRRTFPGGWGWIACSDSVLWGSTGNWGASTALFAYDLKTGKKLWHFPNDGTKFSFYNATIAIGEGCVYFIHNGRNPQLVKQANDEMRAYLPNLPAAERNRVAQEIKRKARDVRMLVAVDAKTGKLRWFRGIDVSDCGGGAAGYTTIKKKKLKYAAAMIYRNGMLLHFNASAGGKYWGHWANGDWDWRGVAARSAKDGRLAWFHQVGFRGRVVVIDDTVHAEPWALDLKTGAFRTRKHPITGEKSRWTWCRFGKQCGIYNASKYFLFGRSAGVGYHDVQRDRGLYTFMLSRSSCWFDTVSGGGLMVKPPQSFGCTCTVALPFTVAMGQVDVEPATPQVYSAWGPQVPVKHLNVDFGATGDRHDKSGRLWLASSIYRAAKIPVIRFKIGQEFYDGGGGIARSGAFTPIANTDMPFVFASAARGLKKCVIPLLRERDGRASFIVRLGFAAPPGDKPGRRVFDVKVQGKTVLKDFDIVKVAGGVDRALWQEIPDVEGAELTLELVSKSQAPSPEQMPILCGLQVLRRKVSALGYAGTGHFLLTRSKRRDTGEIELANLRTEAFRGRLAFETPSGVQLTAPDHKDVRVPVDARIKIPIHIAVSDKAAPGAYTIGVKVLAADGKTVELDKKITLEWLGPLERKAVPVTESYCVRAKALGWHRRRGPEPARVLLAVSGGAKAADDDRAAVSYLRFVIPQDVGKIHRARVRLYPSPLWRVLYLPGMKQKESGIWGTVAQVAGTWPDFTKVKYAERPGGDGRKSRLGPAMSGDGVIEGQVQGKLDGRKELLLAIEPTGLVGAVYWGHGGNEKSDCVPQLLLDYEPK